MLIVIHGGAAKSATPHVPLKLAGVKLAARVGYRVLASGGTAVEAVEAAVRSLEDDPIMNCGYGSSLTSAGTVECDAIVMDGRTMKSGAVAGVERVPHPISLARAVMDSTDHCLMIGAGAERLAQEVGIELVDNQTLVHEFAQKRLNEFKTFQRTLIEDRPQTDDPSDHSHPTPGADNPVVKEHDTVGAVAVDREGNCAVATSTGGITGKRVGRVGDSPIIGAGGYADNTSGAVSTTGESLSLSLSLS
ncbi:unnamed protein product, partial [Medioppia subpectinata]